MKNWHKKYFETKSWLFGQIGSLWRDQSTKTNNHILSDFEGGDKLNRGLSICWLSPFMREGEEEGNDEWQIARIFFAKKSGKTNTCDWLWAAGGQRSSHHIAIQPDHSFILFIHYRCYLIEGIPFVIREWWSGEGAKFQSKRFKIQILDQQGLKTRMFCMIRVWNSGRKADQRIVIEDAVLWSNRSLGFKDFKP